MTKPQLTIEILCEQAKLFSQDESRHTEKTLYGITDGKAIGTYLEHKFKHYLSEKYLFMGGSSASGIDFPDILVDMKVTSITQPQSSCPFKSARQKIWGLGYSLLIFVYEKLDDATRQTATLNIIHTLFIEASKTGDYQTTRGIRQILENDGNRDDLVAFLQDRNLPIDDSERINIAEELLKSPPPQGFLTTNWSFQLQSPYIKAIEHIDTDVGIVSIYRAKNNMEKIK